MGEGWGTGWIVDIDLFDAPEAILGTLLLLWLQLILFFARAFTTNGHSPRTGIHHERGRHVKMVTRKTTS